MNKLLNSPTILLFVYLAADAITWLGTFYLCANACVRRAKKRCKKPHLLALTVSFAAVWLLAHGIFLWMMTELVKWGGMD